MHPRHYLAQAIYDLEQDRLFRELWLFAGLRAMLPEDGGRMQRRVAGTNVTICRESGGYRAYEGRRPVALESIGGLLMVNLGEDPQPLADQFQPAFHTYLKSGAAAFDGPFVMTNWKCRFNWKLAYENLRDPLHVQFLHSRSFGNYVDFTIRVPEGCAQEAAGLLPAASAAAMRSEMRRFSRGGAIGAIAERRRVPWHDKVHRWGGGREAYFDWLVYPNVHISSGNGGHSFCIEHHVPVGPDRTDLEVIWVMSPPKQPFDEADRALLEQMHGSKRILREDVDMLEAIQAGLHDQAPLPNQGAYEGESMLVERWYTTLMERDPRSEAKDFQ